MNKIRIGNETYSKLYAFDGGTYYTPDSHDPARSWVAVMDDDSLQLLFNGVHKPYDAQYEEVQ